MKGIFFPGLLAGLIAGVFLFGAQQARLVPLILQAETYETAAIADHAAHREQEEPAGAWAPAEGFERTVYSLLANLVTAIGMGLVLAGAMALSRRAVGWREGILWGLAGYAAVHLAPALGLPPELPGMAGGQDIVARQTWVIATIAATAVGLAAVVFGRNWLWRAAGALLIVAPHAVGIPGRAHVESAVPAGLASEFVVASLVIAGLFWILLGGLAGYFTRRAAA